MVSSQIYAKKKVPSQLNETACSELQKLVLRNARGSRGSEQPEEIAIACTVAVWIPLTEADRPRSGSLKLEGSVPISLRRCWNRLAGERRHSRPPAAASHCHDHTASDTTCYTYPLSTPAHPPEAPQTGLYSSVLLLGLASLISRPALRHCACSVDRTGAEMLAAAAAARPVPLRRPGALLRAPVPCSLPASRVAAPFPRRSGT